LDREKAGFIHYLFIVSFGTTSKSSKNKQMIQIAKNVTND